ncbi:MAG: hypothetical protein UCI02_05745, partial [Bifidobacterium criceti]|nr:hypothetical protein [Bifidobacterium criceti]
MNIKENLAAELKAAQDIYRKAEAEGRDLTEEEAKSFDEHCSTAERLKEQLAGIAANAKKLN